MPPRALFTCLTQRRLLASNVSLTVPSAANISAYYSRQIRLRRGITSEEKPLPKAPDGKKGPNQEQLPHVSEEAAATAKVTGEGGPELEQGTPVEEVLKRDPEAQEHVPKVMREKSGASQLTGTRSFHTSARRLRPEAPDQATSSTPVDGAAALSEMVGVELQGFRQRQEGLEPTAEWHGTNMLPNKNEGSGEMVLPYPKRSDVYDETVQDYGEGEGLLFEAPQLPLPETARMKKRHKDHIEQLTKMLMKDGKLIRAQRDVSIILERLRTAQPPRSNPEQPLIPGSPQGPQLPLDPAEYVRVALDSIAPLMRIRSQKGAAGGGQSLQIPIPLNVRQRRRQAIIWITGIVEKKLNQGGGRDMYARKFADELIAIVEGRSNVWEKRTTLHKLGMNARANMGWKPRGR